MWHFTLVFFFVTDLEWKYDTLEERPQYNPDLDSFAEQQPLKKVFKNSRNGSTMRNGCEQSGTLVLVMPAA